MPKHLMIAVDWFGPYASLADAREAAKPYDWDGLYLCLGKTGQQRQQAIQYIGISKSLSGRLTSAHHKLGKVSSLREETAIRDMKIWLGEIVTAEPSGKKVKVTKATLDSAEWLHAHFLRLPLNDRKTKKLPDRNATVLNRWYKTDFDTPRRNRPHPDWPDLIDFPDHSLPARAVWFGGRQRVFPATNYSDDG